MNAPFKSQGPTCNCSACIFELKSRPKRVVVESPFAGDVVENIRYAKKCIKDCLARGEAPIASHLLFTQPGILCDALPDERKAGIEAGLAWHAVADLVVFYIDRGVSPGMVEAVEHAKKIGKRYEFRMLERCYAPA